MSKKIKLFSVGLAVFVVVLLAFAGTALASYDFTNHASDHSMIADPTYNKHDVAPAGTNPCDYCHEPHGASAAFLWKYPASQAAAGNAAGTVDAGYSSDIKPLCYSCHDGTTLVPRTSGTAAVVSIGDMTVFSANHYNHRTTAASFIPTTGSSAGKLTGPGKDCDRCHDPHDDSYSNFLRPEFKTRVYDENGNVVKTNAAGSQLVIKGKVSDTVYNDTTNKSVSWYAPLIKGGDFCATCHEMNLPGQTATTARNVHPVYQPAGFLVFDSNTETIASISNGLLLNNARSTTPVLATSPVPGKNPLVSVWPKAGSYLPTSGLYNGTRVFDPATNGVVTTQNTTAVIMCESCHGPHGANDATATSPDNPTTPFHYLNTMADASLCSNCH